mmetsp:Transcript_17956/g.45051  ORF Transcript_17956/g.45051 Transcript_17956/m.45051 type:complete len:85 (+) Transcript_17956:241-495(+)
MLLNNVHVSSHPNLRRHAAQSKSPLLTCSISLFVNLHPFFIQKSPYVSNVTARDANKIDCTIDLNKGSNDGINISESGTLQVML